MNKQVVRLAAALAALVAYSDPVQSATRRVPLDFATIQQALNASTFGDVVSVDPGTYVENVAFGAAQDGVALVSVGGPQTAIIDGGGQGSTIRCSAVGLQTRIEGFTITNGGQSPLVSLVGGGIYLAGASPTIRGNVIRGNRAVAAGGIYSDGGSPAIVGNEIRDNEAPGGSGGGIYCDHFSNARIESNVIANNTCGAFGGGVTVWETSAPQLVGNTIVKNQAAIRGGGLYVVRSSNPTVSENILAFNAGVGVLVDDAGSSVSAACNDVFQNSPANYSGLADQTGLSGNISANPRFCDLTSLNLHIDSSSPCATGHAPPGCGEMGALGIGCSLTSAQPVSWGQMKARYR